MSTVTPIIMPRWGLEMTEGTLSAWHVDEGERVASGQVIMEIESEKIANEVESEVAGVLRKIVVAAGDTVEIGTLLGVIADEQTSDEVIAEFVRGYRPVTFTDDGESETVPAAPTPTATSTPVQTGSVGDSHASPTARRLASRLGLDLSTIRGSGRGGRISAEDVKAAAASAEQREGEGEGEGEEGESRPVSAGESVAATPTARRAARRLGVDLSVVRGTGRAGRISVEDVERAADTGSSRPAAPATAVAPTGGSAGDAYDVVKLTTMRKTIARRLVASKQTVPHFYLSVELGMDALLEARAGLRDQGAEVSVNDCLLKACALALQDVPEANVQFHGEVLHRFRTSDVAFAVATEGGLITPVVRDAERKSLLELAGEVRDLAERGRTGKLAAEEFQGGTLTLSNLGMYGVDAFAAVINPPQAAILAVGRSGERVIVRDGQPAIGRVMSATLSCDHRAIDGALGARWLQALRQRVETPGDWW